ncbi:MAG: hypothetical protein KF805_00860 [Phycisphaeraceae bacterium]|nr:hypothetical protein [Phycisphaeraceae bacterium]
MSSIPGVSSSVSQLQTLRQGDPQEQQRKADFEKALIAGGADPAQVEAIQSQIRKAIAEAVKNGGTPNGQRPDPSTVKNVIDGVLKANGIDSTKFKESLEASHAAGGAHKGHKHGGHHKNGQGVPETAATPVQDDPSKGNEIDIAA